MDSGKDLGSDFDLCSHDSGCPRPECFKGGICLDEDAPASSSIPILPNVSCYPLASGVSASAQGSSFSCKAIPSDAVSGPPLVSGSCKPHGSVVVPACCAVTPNVSVSLKEGLVLDEDISASFDSHLPLGEEDLCRAPISFGLPGIVHSSSSLTRGVSVPSAGVEGPATSSNLLGDGSVPHSPSATSRPMQGILPTPRSLVLPTSPVCPVISSPHGQPVGSMTASKVFSGVPVVPEPALLRAFSNFELSDINFPPLTSHSDATAGPPCSPFPQSNPDLPRGGTDVASNAPPSWASLVKDPPSYLLLKYIKPVSVADDGKLKVKLPPAIAFKGASVWKNTLVGFFLDKLPFSLVQATANRHWGKLGLSDVLCNGNGFYFFKFSDSGSLNVVLEGGPWYFGGRPIFLKLWAPGMNLSKDGCKRVPIWAHFYNVPLELWTDEGLSFIASTVGKPLHADSSTSSFKRLNYARICIEINIDDSLPNAFDIVLEDGSCLEIQIVYNWVPKKCSVCKDFGHLSKNCKKASHLVWIPKSAQPPVISPSPGDWQPVINHVKDGLDKPSPPPNVLLPHPAKVLSQPVTHTGGLCCSTNIFDSLPSDDVPPSTVIVDNPSFVDQSSGGAGYPSKATTLPVASEYPVAPLTCPSARHVRDTPLSGLPSPSSGSAISSPSSSPSATSLLANKIIMVDEVEKILGRKMKDKKKNRSSGNSRGKTSKPSK